MLKKYYELREVILGLRDEYQAHVKALEELKKYVSSYDYRISDVNFSLPKYSDDEYADLVCRLTFSRKYLEKSKESGQSVPLYGIKRENVYRGIMNKYKIDSDYKIDIFDQSAFNDKVYIIKNSDFSNNIEIPHILNITKGVLQYSLQITDWGISLTLCENRAENDVFFSSYMVYDASTDKLKLSLYSDSALNKSAKENFHDILRVRVPKDELSSYHIRTIDDNPNHNKKVVISRHDAICANQDYFFEDYGRNKVKLIKNK